MAHPLLEQARREGTPFIDGDQVTFVWAGTGPIPRLVGDFNCWGWGHAPVSLQQADPDVWIHTRTFDPDAYIEYAYMVTGQPDRVPDPFNQRSIWNGINAYNHYFHMPEAPVSIPEAQRIRGVARGTVTRHLLAKPPADFLLAGGKRRVLLYAPPVQEPVPLLVVFDGPDYYRRAALVTIIENLTAQGRIRPLALALIEHGRQARFIEYAGSDSTVKFLLDGLLPFAEQHLNLIDISRHPGAHGLLGASMGGWMSLYAALRLPAVFGHVICQSGAFMPTPGYTPALFDLIRHMPPQPIKAWLGCGKYEGLVFASRAVHAVLTESGYRHTYHEFSAGHNYTAWSRVLPQALESLYAP